MKIYPENSALTIRQRLNKLALAKRKNDLIVTVHNNADGDGRVFWFYMDDWGGEFSDFMDNPVLDYRLDNETRSAKYLNLGFNPRRL